MSEKLSPPLLNFDTEQMHLKEGFHQKLKTSEKLQFCLYVQPADFLLLIFSIQNCSQLIWQHLRTRIDPSRGHYFTIRCPVLHHPGPVLHPPQPVLHHPWPVPKLFFAQFFYWKFSGFKENYDRPKNCATLYQRA